MAYTPPAQRSRQNGIANQSMSGNAQNMGAPQMSMQAPQPAGQQWAAPPTPNQGGGGQPPPWQSQMSMGAPQQTSMGAPQQPQTFGFTGSVQPQTVGPQGPGQMTSQSHPSFFQNTRYAGQGPPPSGAQPPGTCLLYTSPSPRDRQKSRMPSSA